MLEPVGYRLEMGNLINRCLFVVAKGLQAAPDGIACKVVGDARVGTIYPDESSSDLVAPLVP